MSSTLRIGTRDSQLALWQAETVKNLLQQHGVVGELVLIKSTGDLEQKKALHEMGTTGVFTKQLDDALLDGRIDIAVHSLKDVPTIPPKGIEQAAVLPRGPFHDVLIGREQTSFVHQTNYQAVVATGSLRRKAQWLNKFPNHQIEGIRGNVDTRLRKLQESNFDGMILAAAGIKRLNLNIEHLTELTWMIPAPAQGVVGIFCRSEDTDSKNIAATINHEETFICSNAERQLLNRLEGGCTAPIGALGRVENDTFSLKACLLIPSGAQKIEMSLSCNLKDADTLGEKLAHQILEQGGAAIMKEIQQLD